MNRKKSSKQAMQLKNLSILASIVAIGLSTTSFAFKAEAQKSNSLLVAQEQPTRGPRGDRFAEQLGLSDAQKARIQAIKNETRAKMDAILTPEQRALKQTAQQNGQGRRGGKNALNLTEAQKNQMKQIREASKAEIKNVLTPEQQQKWEQMRQRKGNRGQQTPRPNNSPS